MAAVLPSAEALAEARAFLRDVVPTRPRLWSGHLAGLTGVKVTHVEDGWVDLSFHGFTTLHARAIADQLLHPDALPTAEWIFRLTDEDGIHFQGFGWDDEPPAGVLAARSPTTPPVLSMALDVSPIGPPP